MVLVRKPVELQLTLTQTAKNVPLRPKKSQLNQFSNHKDELPFSYELRRMEIEAWPQR